MCRTALLLCLLIGHLLQVSNGSALHFTRKITATLNPGCPDTLCSSAPGDDSTSVPTGDALGDQPPLITVVHVRSAGHSDAIHQLWDFTGKPSVLVARTSLLANLTIDWRQFMDNEPLSVRFDEQPAYSTCLVMDRIIQYTDADDVGYLLPVNESAPASSRQQPQHSFDATNITWTRLSFGASDKQAVVDVLGRNAGWFGAEGAVRLRFKAFGRRQYDLESPHMLHSENGTQIDVQLERLNASSPGSSSAERTRFAIELVHVATEPRGQAAGDLTEEYLGDYLLQRRRSLDDEHTPGVFELVDVMSPAARANGTGSYVHYRPVSYRNAERDMSGSTDVHCGRPQNVSGVADEAERRLKGSMAWSFYGYGVDRWLAQAYNVSFGRAEDGFYAKSPMNTWTFEMGYGTPPEEQMSLFVVIVASVGLVLPVVLLLSGALYICVKRMRARRRAEQEFY